MKNISMRIGCHNGKKTLNMLILINLELYFNLSTVFQFDVNNLEWTQRRLNLLNLYRYSFETDMLLVQSQIKSSLKKNKFCQCGYKY